MLCSDIVQFRSAYLKTEIFSQTAILSSLISQHFSHCSTTHDYVTQKGQLILLTSLH